MGKRLSQIIGYLTAAVTPSTNNVPTGKTLASLAIKSETTGYAWRDTRGAIEFVKGTVATCLNVRSSERGVLRFIVRERGKETLTSKAIQHILDMPNPVQCTSDMLEMASQFYDATGQAIMFIIEGDLGLPAELWCLPSFFITAIFEEASDPVPAAYRWADGRAIASFTDICIVKNTSLKTAPYTGMGILSDNLDSAILYDYIVQNQKNWFITGGAPNVALSMPKGTMLDSNQITEMQTMWKNKYNPLTGTSNVAILPDGVTPHNFGPQEMNFGNSKDEIRDSIRESLSVPKMLLGDTDNVNHNNGQTALAMFERTVVLRWGEKVANTLQHFFRLKYGNHITVEVDPEIKKSFTQLANANTIITATAERVPGLQ